MWRRLGPEALMSYALLVHTLVWERLWLVPQRRLHGLAGRLS
jgi:hypothetical protein